MKGCIVPALTLFGVVQGGARRPKKLMDDNDCHQLPWLSTPKYPCGQDNGRNDDGYYVPIKKKHSVRNYQIPIKGKKK